MKLINELSQSINQELETLISTNLGDIFPALSICVIKNRDVVLNQAWGWIDPETQKIPVTTDTYFDLASVTKLFTATAFLAQVSEGKTSIHTPVIEVIPEFGRVSPRGVDGGQDPHTKQQLPVSRAMQDVQISPEKITFFHLLTHTSGLPPWRDVFNVAPPPSPPDPETALQVPLDRQSRWSMAVERLCTYPFVGHADGTVRYSDVGLMMLGEAAARLDHQAGHLDRIIQNRVLEPLQLDRVIFNPVREHGIPFEQIAPTENDPTWRKRRAWGEVHDENACGVGGVAGHAGLFADALSVAQFGETWLHEPTVFGLDATIADEAKREQAETNGERRGLGWMLKSPQNSSAGELYDLQSYGHTGFTGTSLWIDPTRDLVVACLSNRVYPGREKLGIHAFRRALHDLIVTGTD